MKITLCVEENKIECKESGSDSKAIYQIPHFDLRKEKLKIKFEIDEKLCPGIQTRPPPPLEIFSPSFRESPFFNPEIFQTQPPPF